MTEAEKYLQDLLSALDNSCMEVNSHRKTEEEHLITQKSLLKSYKDHCIKKVVEMMFNKYGIGFMGNAKYKHDFELYWNDNKQKLLNK